MQNLPQKTRGLTREAFEHSRYLRQTASANLLGSERQAGKVEHIARATCLKGIVDLSCMPCDDSFMPRLPSSPLTKLPCSPSHTIQAFGRLARKWWLLKLNVQRLCRQYFSTLQMVGGLRAVGVGSSSELAEAPQPRFHAPPCKRCWRQLEAQLRADRMRAVLNG